MGSQQYLRRVYDLDADAIALGCYLSKRTLYREFGSKDQLVAQSLDAKGPEIIALWLPSRM